MSGFVNDLSTTQQEALKELHSKLETLTQEQKTEFDIAFAKKFTEEATLLRFLRARDFHVDGAFKMLSDCLEWRTTFQGTGVRNIDTESIKKEIDSGKVFYHGKDKMGRPLCYITVRLHDSHESDIEKVQRFLVYMMEKGSDLLVPPMETCTALFDLSDLHTKNLDLKATKFFAETLEKHYPESLGWALIVKSPLIFTGFWKIVHPLLPAETAKKVKFVKEEELKDYIDESELLTHYGGKDTYEFKTESESQHS